MPALSRCFALVLALAAGAGLAEEVTVEAKRRDDGIEVACRAMLTAPADLIWQTLTDYNRLADFVPGMRSSRVVERRGAVAVIEQLGEARFLIFSVPIEVTITSTERPPFTIEGRLLKGNLKRFEGAYRIEPQGGARMLLRWDGVIEPGGFSPPLLTELLARSIIEEQFRGIVGEIERRDLLRRGHKAPGS